MRRLPAHLTLRPRDLHGRLGPPHQHRVLRHRHHVVEPRLGIQEVEELRGRETAVERHEKPHPRKRRPQQGQQPTQQADGPVRGHRLSGAQHRRAQILLHLAVEGQERQLRQVTPRAIVPVEERELLSAVRPVVGRVQIDRDTPRPPVQAAPMPLDDASRQLPSHPVEGAATHVVLEPRDRRLRRQARAGHRVPPEQQLVDGVVGEVVGIVAIRMTARDAKDPLANHVREGVPNLLRRAFVGQTSCERLDQAVHPLGRLEQNPAAVRACLLLVERGEEGLVEEIWKQDSL